jgi:hypothetical protein
MSPEDMIFTFKQKDEERFKEAWSRIFDWHGKTKPKMTLSLLLSSFYFGLALRYRYALDATAEGDFLHYDGDHAFNCRCSGYRGIPVHLLLGPIISPSSAQGRANDPSYGEDPHEEAPHQENDGENC